MTMLTVHSVGINLVKKMIGFVLDTVPEMSIIGYANSASETLKNDLNG